MTAKILVTGASGNVGRELVKSLLAMGAAVRTTVLDAEDAGKVPGEDVEKVPFDFGKPETWGPALAGVERMFLMRPPAIADVARYVNPVVDAAHTAGVQQIVFLSLLGVNPAHRTGKWSRSCWRAACPILSCAPASSCKTSTPSTRQASASAMRFICPLAGAKPASWMCATSGPAAAVVLTQPGHTGRAYELTGPEALDYYQVADIFTCVLGRQISYARPTPGLSMPGGCASRGTPMSLSRCRGCSISRCVWAGAPKSHLRWRSFLAGLR